LGQRSQGSDRLPKITEKHAKLYRKECAMESVIGLQKVYM